MSVIPLKAGAGIAPSRFIKLSAAFTAIEATAATDKTIGISAESAKDAPGVGSVTDHAEAGDPVQYYGHGQSCLLEASAAIAAGAMVAATTDGKGVTASAASSHYAGAIAWQAAAADADKIRVLVIPPTYIA